MLIKLHKLAYRLDKMALYDEVKEIEEVMKSLSAVTVLTVKDMILLADYFDQIGDTKLANRFDEMVKESISQKKQRPPKKWWDKMEKEIKKNSPEYSDERVAQVIGDIWFNNLTEKKRQQISDRDRKPDKKKKKDK